MTKTKINCFHISLVWDHNRWDRETHSDSHTHTHKQSVLLPLTFFSFSFFARSTRCTRSKWICMDQNETSLIDKKYSALCRRHQSARGSSQLEPNISSRLYSKMKNRSVLWAAYAESKEASVCTVCSCAIYKSKTLAVVPQCWVSFYVRALLNTWLSLGVFHNRVQMMLIGPVHPLKETEASICIWH